MKRMRKSALCRNISARLLLSAATLSLSLVLTGCPVSGTASAPKRPAPRIPTTDPKNVLISWTANRETAVNSAGGGYKVHYSTRMGFPLPADNFVDVPYVSGATAPTSVVVSLTGKTTWYIRVVPYSALEDEGTASSQISVAVR